MINLIVSVAMMILAALSVVGIPTVAGNGYIVADSFLRQDIMSSDCESYPYDCDETEHEDSCGAYVISSGKLLYVKDMSIDDYINRL